MSRTTHTTPAFPRTLRGPRGGRHIAPTPCVVCVSFASCRPGACSAPFGCESWTDEDGRRVDVLADLDIDPQAVDLAALDEPDPEDPNPYAPSPATLSEMSGIFPTDTNDPEDVPEPEPDWEARHRLRTGLLKSRGGILAEPAPEPDGGGFTFETMGGLVKGKCGAPKAKPDDPEARRITEADARKILAAQPVKSFPYLDNDDPGPLFSGRKSN